MKHSRTPVRTRGFTLIEFVGVIAIIAILAGYGLISAQRTLIENRRTAEETSLKGIAAGLSNVVKQALSVPSSSTWSTAVAAQLNRSVNEILTNSLGNRRTVLVDPTFQIGAPSLPFSALPYTQTIAGSREPRNLNFIILSSLDAPLPTSGLTFSNIWNSADDALPAGWPTSWKGAASDLKRERVTLTGLFYRLILNNLDATNSASWSMGTGTTNAITPNSRRELWVVDGTSVDLHNSDGGLFARDILHADASYIYMAGRWVQAVVPVTVALNDPAVGLVTTVDTFLNTANNTAQTGGTGGTGGDDDDDDGPSTSGGSTSGCGSAPAETVAAGTDSGCKSAVTVFFNGCTNRVYVTSTKDLSNVVLEMCDGTRYKYDNLSSPTGWFASPDGKNIVRVWVKSGCYMSGDGPGYGWRVDGPCVTGCCDNAPVVRNPAPVVEAAFNCIRSFTTWSNNTGCSKSGGGTQQYNQCLSHRNTLRDACNSIR